MLNVKIKHQLENTIKFNCVSNKYIYINLQYHPLSLLKNTDMYIFSVCENYIAVDFCKASYLSHLRKH